MSSRFFLGTVAIATGAIIYEKNRKQHQKPEDLIFNREVSTSSSTLPGKETFAKAGGADSKFVPSEYTTTIVNGASEHPEQHGGLSSIKDGILDDAKSLKDAILRHTIGGAEKSEKEIKEHLAMAKTSAYDGAKTEFGSPHTPSNNNATIFNFGDSKIEETRAKLLNEYDEANKKFHELKDEFADHASEYKNEKKKQMESRISDAQQKVSELKDQLDATAKDFKNKVHQDVNKLSDKIYKSELATQARETLDTVQDQAAAAKEDLSTTVNSVTDKILGSSDDTKELKDDKYATEEQLARETAHSLHGWGDTASVLSEEQYEALKKEHETLIYGETKQKAKKWWNWGVDKTSDAVENLKKD